MYSSLKSPKLAESKVAKYIKFGQADPNGQPQKLTASVYLRNLKIKQELEK